MCGGVYYKFGDKDFRVYFPNPKACLPVRKLDNSLALYPWGRRKEQQGFLPKGGWARLESIYAGTWDKYHPRPVKIIVVQFMEKDIEGTSHWFDVTKGQFIQGLIARRDNEQRIYVVTISPEFEDAVHERWPRILSG